MDRIKFCIGTSVYVACMCVFLAPVSLGQQCEQGLPELRMSMVIPRQYSRVVTRKLTGAAKNRLEAYNSNCKDHEIFRNYTLQGMIEEVGELMTYSPPQILNILCNVVVGHNTSMVFFKQDTTSDENHLAEEYILKMTTFLGIPVLAYSSLVNPSPQSLILQMMPSIRHQCRAMFRLLSRYRWFSFSIVTSAITGNNHFIETLRELAEASNEPFNILSVIQILSTEHAVINTQLKKLKSTECRVILFYSSEEQAKNIFREAMSLELFTEEFVWIASKTVIGNAAQDDQSPSSFPIGLLAVNYATDDEETLRMWVSAAVDVWFMAMENIYRDMAINSSLSNFKFSPNYRCSGQRNSHFDIPRWEDGKILYEYMKGVVLPKSRNQYGSNKRDREVSFAADGTLNDVKLLIYNINTKRRWREIGSWTPTEGLEVNDVTWPNDTLTPPAGRPAKYQLKVVTLMEVPYVKYSDPDNSGCPPQSVPCRIASRNKTTNVANATSDPSLYQCASGLSIDLLIRLGHSIGFDFELYQVEDALWGSEEPNGEWNGLVRDVMNEDADMVMTSLKITPERNSVIDFSIPYLETGITIIVAVRDGVISPTAFLEPYDYPSWCLILVFSVHASGAAIFIFEWLSPSGLDRGNKPIREHRFSLFRSFWLIWAMLFGAAVNVDNPRGVSSRFLGNIWALFAVVFTASYTANLAAFMITKEDFDRLSGIQDWRLVHPKRHKPPFKFGTIPHGSTDTNIKKTNSEMHEWMSKFNKSTPAEGVKAVKDGEMNAFIYDATVLEFMASEDKGCKLRTVGSWYAMTGYGVGFPKGSKWITVVNEHLAEYQYDGVMERLQKFWLAGACKKGEQEGESSMPLGILNFTSAFILLAGGMLLGGLLLLLEHVYFKFFRAKLRKWDKCGCCGLVSLSMGKSLTFEQSVREAIDLQKHFKCKNPICETQVWKLKHELDLALLKIERLQRQLDPAIAYDKRAVWKDPTRRRNPPAIGWKPDVYPQDTRYHVETPEAGSTRPKTRLYPDNRQSQTSGWEETRQLSESPYEAINETMDPSNIDPSGYEPNQNTPLLSPPNYNELSAQSKIAGTPDTMKSDASSYHDRPGEVGKSLSMTGTARSTPSSPIKRPVAGPSSRIPTTSLIGQPSDPNGPIGVQYEVKPGTEDSSYHLANRPSNKCGNAIEIETVL